MNADITPYAVLEPIFRKNQEERNQRYSNLFSSIDGRSKDKSSILKELEENGYAIVPNFFDKVKLTSIYNRFEGFLATGENLSAPRKLRGINEQVYGQSIPRLTKEELQRGVASYHDLTDNVQIKDPLINCPGMLELAVNDFFVDLAAAYLGGFPALTYLKCVRNFANDIKEFDTQYFHIDENAAKLIKFFVYLNDVDTEGGPFCYVKGSHKRKTEFWGKKLRWTTEEIEDIFGEENVILCTAKRGDLVIADTTGFHRGTKPVKTDRNIIIINYGVHQDYTFGGKLDITSNAHRVDVGRLSPKQQAACDLLVMMDK